MRKKEGAAYMLPTKEHNTKNIVIKRANVDIGIAPVVQWLNSFETIETKGSCEGTEDPVSPPMVSFVVLHQADLLKVLVILDKYPYAPTLEIKVGELPVVIWYYLNFKDKEQLKGFISYLKTGEPQMWSRLVQEVAPYPFPYRRAKKI